MPPQNPAPTSASAAPSTDQPTHSPEYERCDDVDRERARGQRAIEPLAEREAQGGADGRAERDPERLAHRSTSRGSGGANRPTTVTATRQAARVPKR